MVITVEINNLTIEEYDKAIERHTENPYGLEAAVRNAVLSELRSETVADAKFIKVKRSDR